MDKIFFIFLVILLICIGVFIIYRKINGDINNKFQDLSNMVVCSSNDTLNKINTNITNISNKIIESNNITAKKIKQIYDINNQPIAISYDEKSDTQNVNKIYEKIGEKNKEKNELSELFHDNEEELTTSTEETNEASNKIKNIYNSAEEPEEPEEQQIFIPHFRMMNERCIPIEQLIFSSLIPSTSQFIEHHEKIIDVNDIPSVSKTTIEEIKPVEVSPPIVEIKVKQEQKEESDVIENDLEGKKMGDLRKIAKEMNIVLEDKHITKAKLLEMIKQKKN